MKYEEYINAPQFSFTKGDKEALMLSFLNDLHAHHLSKSIEYQKISSKIFQNTVHRIPSEEGDVSSQKRIENLENLPFLPVSIFKTHALKSIADADVFKVLTSSGTTGSVPSRIYLDKETAALQTLALSKIMTHILGNERLPMLIIDSKSVLTDRASFSARGAGILGLSVFGRKHHYILDADMQLDKSQLDSFFDQFDGQRILIFGFTFMVWQYLFEQVNRKIDLSKAILIHSGGWKKLLDRAVDNDTFRQRLHDKFGLTQIYNFYGMVEQVGSVFLENEKGYLHCPNFSDILIRNPRDLSVQAHGEEGLVQVISILPRSYAGHSILTEDIGVCLGEDDLMWKGKYFKILGRAKKADLRGCSDTFKK